MEESEYSHELVLSEEVILPPDKKSYVVKLKVRGEEDAKSVVLNPYVELVNGTDLLITKGKFDALLMSLTVALRNVSGLVSKFFLRVETSPDGINYNRVAIMSISINSGEDTWFYNIPFRLGYPDNVRCLVPSKNNTY